jgi:regulator of protease activity HflC (stomatin/prohibitin superfamily)
MSEALIPIVFIVVIAAIVLTRSLVVLKGMERGVVFRLGKPLDKVIGPGIALTVPLVDRLVRVSLEEQRIEIPDVDVRTSDEISTTLSATVRYRIMDPLPAVTEIHDLKAAIGTLVASVLRASAEDFKLDDLSSGEFRKAVVSRLAEPTQIWGASIAEVTLERRRF